MSLRTTVSRWFLVCVRWDKCGINAARTFAALKCYRCLLRNYGTTLVWQLVASRTGYVEYLRYHARSFFAIFSREGANVKLLLSVIVSRVIEIFLNIAFFYPRASA